MMLVEKSAKPTSRWQLWSTMTSWMLAGSIAPGGSGGGGGGGLGAGAGGYALRLRQEVLSDQVMVWQSALRLPWVRSPLSYTAVTC